MSRRSFGQVEAAAMTAEREQCAAHADLWAARAEKKAQADSAKWSHVAKQFRAFAQDLRTGLHTPDDEGNTPRRQS